MISSSSSSWLNGEAMDVHPTSHNSVLSFRCRQNKKLWFEFFTTNHSLDLTTIMAITAIMFWVLTAAVVGPTTAAGSVRATVGQWCALWSQQAGWSSPGYPSSVKRMVQNLSQMCDWLNMQLAGRSRFWRSSNAHSDLQDFHKSDEKVLR